MDVKLCLTCKGLSMSDKWTSSEMERHTKQCHNRIYAENFTSPSLFDFYACDKSDFEALREIKQILNSHVCERLKNRKADSDSDASEIDNILNKIIESLLKLSISKNIKSPICNDNQRSVSCSTSSPVKARSNFMIITPLIHTDMMKDISVLALDDVNPDDCNDSGNGIVNNEGLQNSKPDKISTLTSNPNLPSESHTIEISASTEKIQKITEDEMVILSKSPILTNKISTLSSIHNSPSVSPVSKNATSTDSIQKLTKDKMVISWKLPILTDEEQAKLKNECDMEKKENTEVFVCKLCKYQNKSSRFMIRHLSSHNNGQAFHCKECNFSTLARSAWTIHQYKHDVGLRFICHLCSAKFPSECKLESHLDRVHSGGLMPILIFVVVSLD